ncbi:MAG TPA: GGDEF domain-containing protein [Polyangia bacterium]|nr:GGDEF domain-containing protein [Polyangia bacterium]
MVEETTQPGRRSPSGERTKPTPPPPAERPEDKRPYLVIIAGDQLGEIRKIDKTPAIIGRGHEADIRIADDGISREHVEVIGEPEHVTVRDLGSTNGTFHNGRKVDEVELVDGDKLSIGSTTILKFSYRDGFDEAFEQRLSSLGIRDELTRALKKAFFLDRLESEVAFSIRHRTPIALIMWELDGFQAVKRIHGPTLGASLLSATAYAVTRVIRREDVFVRYGGEEFGLLCRNTPVDNAVRMAERLREVIGETVVGVGSELAQVTASFGVATCPAAAPGIVTPADLIAAADSAMRRAKHLGRNRVET